MVSYYETATTLWGKTVNRQDIKSLSHDGLRDALERLGQPSFRAGQIEQWLWQKGCTSFDEMTNLSKDLRSQLEEHYTLRQPGIIDKQVSRDGTRKYLIAFDADTAVETVGIPSQGGSRLTVCFSTQAGCAMGCVFCATGQGGFKRNLGFHEMLEQIMVVQKDFGQRVSNVVAMGQGEPFANYDQVLLALRYLNDKKLFGIGARHITVSTCGIPEGIARFAEEPEQFTLALSLHSAIQETRDALMPATRAYPLPVLREALCSYIATTNRRPTLEYALIDQVNDSDAHLEALVAFCTGLLCHVNLIPLNPIRDSSDKTRLAPSTRMHLFEQTLTSRGIETSIRNSRGADIDGACGQLSQKAARRA